MTKWINVRKQKPPLDTPILLFVRYKYNPIIYIGEYVIPPYKKRPKFATNIFRASNGTLRGGFPLEEATHWMLLPEPPTFREKLNV
jgi:hypothetical protein